MAAIVLSVIASALPVAHADPPPVHADRPRSRCHTRSCEIRVRRKRMQRYVRPYLPWLNATGRCESGNDPHANTGNGFYGEHQWLPSTWRATGGRGMPQYATRLRQRYQAVKLVRADGPHHWPVCGMRAAYLLP